MFTLIIVFYIPQRDLKPRFQTQTLRVTKKYILIQKADYKLFNINISVTNVLL